MTYPSEVDSNSTSQPRHGLDFSLLQHYLNEVGVDNAQVFVHSQVASTNDVIRTYVPHLGNVDVIAVAADEQTAGRGRLDRTWVSSFGLGIALSIAVSETKVAVPLSTVPLVSGLAVHRALQRCGLEIGLKWPNDLVVVDAEGELRKLGGILVQRFDDCLVIGIGINLDHDQEQLPIPQATSARLLGYEIEHELLIAYLLNEVNILFQSDTSWHAEYRANCVSIGAQVQVQRVNSLPIEGVVEDVDVSGHLLLRSGPDLICVESGDVQHLKRL